MFVKPILIEGKSLTTTNLYTSVRNHTRDVNADNL